MVKEHILGVNFTIQVNRPMQNYVYSSRQLTPKAKKESQHSSQIKRFTTFSEANNKQTGSQENNLSTWTVRLLTLEISKQTLEAKLLSSNN